MDEVYATIGQQLRGLREARGITQREVAEVLGVTHSAVSHIEKGAVRGRLDRLQAYAQYVGADVVLELRMKEPCQETLLARIARLLPVLSPELRRTLSAWVDLWEQDYGTASDSRPGDVA